MPTPIATQLETQLASILEHVEALQQRNVALEEERRAALAELPRLLGAVSRYQHWLEKAVPFQALRPAA